MCLGLDIWVPEIVGPCVRPPDAGGNGFEPLVESVDGIVAPGFSREHQIARVCPGGASSQPILQLLHPLVPEVFKGNGWGLDGAGLTAFGAGGNVVFTALDLLPLELLTYGDSSLLKIHLSPGKAQALPLSQTGEQAKGVGVAHGRVVNSGQEQGNFVICKRADFFVLCLWQLRRVARVGGYDPLLQGHAECLVHDGAGVLDCLSRQARLGH